MGLWHTDGSPNLSQETRPNNHQQQQKKEHLQNCRLCRIKLKECEKKDKYLDLARELKKLWNMKVAIIPVVNGAFGTVTKGLLKGLEDLEVGGRVETIQTTALLRTARIVRRVLETWEDLLSLKRQWKTVTNADVKNSQGLNNNNDYTDHLISARRLDLIIINKKREVAK